MIIAIDPGLSGGIAWQINNKVLAAKMGATPRDIFEQLQLLSQADEDVICYIERTGGYMTGNSAVAAVKFSRHCGQLEGFLISLSIPYIEVTAQKWQSFFIGKPNYPKIPKSIQGKARKQILAKRKTERKNKIKAKAQALYPHLKITLATSDVLGILTYGIDKEEK